MYGQTIIRIFKEARIEHLRSELKEHKQRIEIEIINEITMTDLEESGQEKYTEPEMIIKLKTEGWLSNILHKSWDKECILLD